MTGRPDTAAQLTALAAWIDEQLGDEMADRQWIAESAAARVHDIALQMPGHAELAAGRPAVPPLETEAQTRALPAVRAIYGAMHRADPRQRAGDQMCAALIINACGAAGVQLGGYDRRIIGWLAGWEPQMCAVVAGLIERAASAAECRQSWRDGYEAGCDDEQRSFVPELTPDRRQVLGQALADAIEHRTPQGFCPDCDAHPAGLCADHAADLDKTDAYLALARDLGIEVER